MAKFYCFELILFLALVSTFILATQVGHSKDAVVKNPNKWQALLDWHAYMKFFNKKYSSLAQQLVRQKLFMARAMGVFVSGVKYSMYKISYFTAINRFSDVTPQEAEKMLSGDISEPLDSSDPSSDEKAKEILLQSLQEQGVDVKVVEEELRKKLERLASPRRRKRSTSEEHHLEPRPLSVDDLVRVEGESGGKDKQWNIKIQRYVPSNNEDYEQIETVSFGTKSVSPQDSIVTKDIPEDKLKEMQKAEEESKSGSIPFMQSVFSGASSFFGQGSVEGEEEVKGQTENKRSVMITKDWRDTGCISQPISQGDCLSCYALSSMSYVEWALCMSQDRVLTPLSVQYMVDCGKQFKDETDGVMRFEGCRRGLTRQTMDFIQEYGIELEVNLPYLEEETYCPIAPFTPRKKKGYIRPNVKPIVRLGAKTTQLDLALRVGPVIVSMREPKDFLAYGGGMVDSCENRGGHAMLIVGSGVEDGIEFLLVKNSFGTSWGYDGYFKFKRSSAVECVKEYIVPMVTFPSLKSQKRRIKAYMSEGYGSTIELEPSERKKGELGKISW